MQKLSLLLLLIVLTASAAFTQTFTFSDTYPTNNVDSLENWLKTHTRPTQERLKNLIRLNRTYILRYKDRSNRDTLEIRQLSQRLNHPVGKIISTFWRSQNFNDYYQAFRNFEALKDTSGMIFLLSSLAFSNYDVSAMEKGDRFAANDYLLKASQLLKARFDAHDYFILERALFRHNILNPDSDKKALLQSLHKALKLCENNPQYQYMWISLKAYIAGIHFHWEDHATSYAIHKEILAHLKPDQTHCFIMYTQNLANDCAYLKRYDERLALLKKTASFLRVYPHSVFPYEYKNLYTTLKEEMDLRGRYREASRYGDSIVTMQNIIYTIEHTQKLIEFQAENKQKQIAELTIQKIQTQNRTRLILILLAIALAVAVALSFLGLRLRQANTQLRHLTHVREHLFGIIAHDLRRPMFAFQNIKALVGFHLRKKNYYAIEELSLALDESGLRLQKMLDNLVAWAMSQQETLPYQPQNLPIRERVQAIVDLYSGVNLLKGVRFDVDIPETLTAYADPNGFDLIVRNLIDNSFKALSQQGQLRISAHSIENQQISLAFEDDAAGMNAEILTLVQSVFDAPERAQIGQGGMGMGLIMVGRFVKRNQGHIRVESEAGKGTTFTITFLEMK